MSDSPALLELRARMTATEARLDALERTPHPADAPAPDDRDDLWAVTGLSQRIPAPGAVMLVGDVVIPSGVHALWQEGLTTAALLDEDWSARAASLAALAHPVRLKLVRLALDGPVSAKELWPSATTWAAPGRSTTTCAN